MMLKTTAEIVLRKSSALKKHLLCFSTVAQPRTNERLQSFRTSETNPTKHTSEHEAQFYTVSKSDKNQIFPNGSLPKSFEEQIKTFNETCFMIRQPSIDIFNCLRAIDYSRSAIRFVLYGKKGSGKSVTLAHILHYAYTDDFLMVHVPWVGNWMRRCKEYSNSESKDGFVDLNIDAAAWLSHFKTQNSHLLSKPEFRTTSEHLWSKRESTPKGSSLLDLVDHGINRIKYASDTVVVLCNEIKEISSSGVCKTLVAVDGFNAFFYPNTKVYTEKKEMVHPQRITLTEGFLNISKYDWKNAIIVVTVDELAMLDEDQTSHLPRYLLGKDGFEHMDPFVPVLVPHYTKKEFLSCLDYYRERKWIQPYPGQDEELEFISASNPYKLMQITAGL